jgi:hypothetical protein
MTRKTSAEAFSRSNASSRSRVRRAMSASCVVVAGRLDTVWGGVERLCVAAFRRRALPAFERRFIAVPSAPNIVAGQTLLPEVAPSQRSKWWVRNVAMGQNAKYSQ